MQETFGNFRDYILNPNVFRLALWFHFIVFVPFRADNKLNDDTGTKNAKKSVEKVRKFIEEVKPEFSDEEI